MDCGEIVRPAGGCHCRGREVGGYLRGRRFCLLRSRRRLIVHAAVAGVAISPARHAGARLLPSEVRPGRRTRHYDPGLRPMRIVRAAPEHGERLALHPRALISRRQRELLPPASTALFFVFPILHFARARLLTSCDSVIARRRLRRSCPLAHTGGNFHDELQSPCGAAGACRDDLARARPRAQTMLRACAPSCRH